MRTVAGVLILSLCFTPAAVDLRLESPQSAGQVDAQKQAWNILVGGAHGSNMDKRANAIQALGLASGDLEAVRLAEDALGDKEALVRGAAAKALGALGSPESIPKLQNLLADQGYLGRARCRSRSCSAQEQLRVRRLLFPRGWRSEGQNITDHRRTEPNEDSGEGHPVCV